MHTASLVHMRANLKKYGIPPCKVLDVGSMNIEEKGCYRQVLTDEHDYTGIDLEAGDNVDVVLKDPYIYPFEDDTFDVVLCGQVLEHCENPFKLMEECYRVLKPGGFFFGVAPFKWDEHRFPVDCWRILPDGWKALFTHTGLTHVETYINKYRKNLQDCWGIAKK